MTFLPIGPEINGILVLKILCACVSNNAFKSEFSFSGAFSECGNSIEMHFRLLSDNYIKINLGFGSNNFIEMSFSFVSGSLNQTYFNLKVITSLN